jgi:hypothetical protein
MNDKKRKALLKEIPSIQKVQNDILRILDTNTARIINDPIALSEFEDALIICSNKLERSLFTIGNIYASDAAGYDNLPEGIRDTELGDSLLESAAKVLNVINSLEEAAASINKLIDKIEENIPFESAEFELVDVIPNLYNAVQHIEYAVRK